MVMMLVKMIMMMMEITMVAAPRKSFLMPIREDDGWWKNIKHSCGLSLSLNKSFFLQIHSTAPTFTLTLTHAWKSCISAWRGNGIANCYRIVELKSIRAQTYYRARRRPRVQLRRQALRSPKVSTSFASLEAVILFWITAPVITDLRRTMDPPFK